MTAEELWGAELPGATLLGAALLLGAAMLLGAALLTACELAEELCAVTVDEAAGADELPTALEDAGLAPEEHPPRISIAMIDAHKALFLIF